MIIASLCKYFIMYYYYLLLLFLTATQVLSILYSMYLEQDVWLTLSIVPEITDCRCCSKVECKTRQQLQRIFAVTFVMLTTF